MKRLSLFKDVIKIIFDKKVFKKYWYRFCLNQTNEYYKVNKIFRAISAKSSRKRD